MPKPSFSLHCESSSVPKHCLEDPVQLYSCLACDSWEASGILTSCFIYCEKLDPIRSLMASLAGKTVDFDHVILIPGPTDSWGPSGTVGLFHFAFVWLIFNSLIHSLDQYYSCSVIITMAVLRQIEVCL